MYTEKLSLEDFLTSPEFKQQIEVYINCDIENFQNLSLIQIYNEYLTEWKHWKEPK